MKFSEILLQFVNQEKPEHERVAGRYWSSELYQMYKGYLKPKDFFKPKKIDLTGARNITTGLASEAMLKRMLEELKIKFEHEPKKIIKIDFPASDRLDEIELVVKPDFVFENFLIETKHPTKLLTEIPVWYQFQCEAEYQAFQRQVYLGVFSYPFNLTLYPYKPNKVLWETIIKVLNNFHKELCKIQKIL